VGYGATRCAGCGLVFLPTSDGPGIASTPAHVELYLGEKPAIASAPALDAGVERETPFAPSRPVDPRARRRLLIVFAAVALAIVAGVVALVRAHRPNDAYTRHELAFERFLDSERLAPVAVPDPIDVDAYVAEIGRSNPEALRAATAAHRPLPNAENLSFHQFFDAFLERLLEASPDYAFHLGVHPHPHGVSGVDDASRLRWLMLCRDASRALRSWPHASELSPHDRADRDALLGWIEFSLRWRQTRDIELLEWVPSWFSPLVHLAEIRTCPETDRMAAATDRLRAIPARLVEAVGLLKNPPKALVLSTAAHLDDADAYLADYADSWPGASESAGKDLRAAIESAREAARACAARLRGDVLVHANGDLAISASNVADVVRVYHRLPFDARTIYAEAADELRAAHDELRRLASEPPKAGEIVSRDPDDAQVAGLRRSTSKWVAATPTDEGLVVSPMPRLRIGESASASYLDPGSLGPAAGGVVHVRPPPAAAKAYTFEAEFEALRRRHTLAHETYPGHRMEAVFRRSTCALRRFIDDRVFVEGWAVYAEDLLHETRDCAGGSMDDWIRAERRATRANSAMIALLVATGAATDDEVLGLLQTSGWPHATLKDVGARLSPTLYALNYLLGLDEIRRLRRDEEKRLGAAFDLRAFHERLLSEGPIPPRLIEEEWKATSR